MTLDLNPGCVKARIVPEPIFPAMCGLVYLVYQPLMKKLVNFWETVMIMYSWHSSLHWRPQYGGCAATSLLSSCCYTLEIQ